ncbi:MAG: MBL fold metallo-hydrolase [Chthoniobacteraceae bacterium]|nr:MBL fold metallo-hydrolase [Chthoniobacteraceae bacterium]
MIGCDCPVCRSADPRDRRTRSSLYVETPEAAWVIDTGPEFRVQCLRENVRRVDAVVYTHAHTDHVMGFDDLRRFCEGDKWLPIYGAPETLDDLRRIFFFAFNGPNLYPGYVKPDPRPVEPFAPFQIGETTLTPLPMKHGRSVARGYLLERGGRALAAYLSDCKEVGEEVIRRIRGVDVLILDALRHREHPTHMNFDEALALTGRVRPGVAWFTHLCHEIGHAQAEAALPPGVRLAYDGLRLEIPAPAPAAYAC